MLQETTIDTIKQTMDKLQAEINDLADFLDKSGKLLTTESLMATAHAISIGNRLPEGSADPLAVALTAAGVLERKVEFLRKSVEMIGLRMILDRDATAKRDAALDDRIRDLESTARTLDNRTIGLMNVGGLQ